MVIMAEQIPFYARFMRLWRWLTEPKASVAGTDARQKARLLASLLLALTTASICLLPLPLLASHLPALQDPQFVSASIAIVFCLVAYRYSLRGSFLVASWMVIVFGTGAIFLPTFVTGGQSAADALYYLLTLVIFAALFLSLRGALGVLILQSVVFAFIAPFIPHIASPNMLVAPFAFNLFIGGVVILVARHWQRLEQERQKTLALNETRYRQISELMSDYVFSYRIQPDRSMLLEWNSGQAYMHRLGYTNPELQQGARWAFHPDELPVLDAMLEKTCRGEITRSEHRIFAKSGETLWARIGRQPIWDEAEGRVVRYYGVVQDITAQKQAEIALRENEERYRIISEMISDYAYLVRVDEDGNLHSEWMTESVSRVTGYTRQEMLEAPPFHMFYPDDRATARDDVQKVIQGESLVSEYRVVAKSGEVRWVRFYRRPIWDEQKGRVVRIYVVAQDITNEKQNERHKLQLALEQERLTMVNEFLLALSHDFRNGLATIETSRYLLQRLSDNEARLQPQLEKIHHSVKHMTDQLDNLYMISSLSPPDMLPCQLNQVIENTIVMLDLKARQKGQKLTFVRDAQLPQTLADEAKLTQALRHLITNAITYTNEGGAINLYTHYTEGQAVIEIQDSGIGIEPEKVEAIFLPFYKADLSRTPGTGGIGLGLSIVKMIVESHAGHITLESEVGKGSLFQITLPLRDPTAHANGQ